MSDPKSIRVHVGGMYYDQLSRVSKRYTVNLIGQILAGTILIGLFFRPSPGFEVSEIIMHRTFYNEKKALFDANPTDKVPQRPHSPDVADVAILKLKNEIIFENFNGQVRPVERVIGVSPPQDVIFNLCSKLGLWV